MNLIGTKVLHKTFGTGEIVQQTDKKIIIQFKDKERSFIHPSKDSPFQTGLLSVEDPALHAAIMDENRLYCAQALSAYLQPVAEARLVKKEERNQKKKEETLKKQEKKAEERLQQREHKKWSTLTPTTLAALGILDEYYDAYNTICEEYRSFAEDYKKSHPYDMLGSGYVRATSTLKTKVKNICNTAINTRPEIFTEHRSHIYLNANNLITGFMVRYHAPPNQMHHTFRLATFSEFLVDLYNAIVRKLLRYREYEGVKITYQEEYQILSNRIETYARKEFSERLTEPSVITSNHPLYIFTALSHTKCYRQHHRVEPRGMVAKLVKGAHQINLPTHYCTECQKHFIGSHTLSVYEKNFGPIIIEKHRLSEYDDSFNTFRMESKLHQLGYNVIDGRLTEEERHNILTSILESGQMSYFSIVSIIEQNVQMFKNSDQHILAVQKWRKDLRFLGDFLLSEDNKD